MGMKKVYLGTNTKMYKGIADTVSYLNTLNTLTADLDRETLELFVIPSFTTLESASRCLSDHRIRLGAQNMGWEDQGPFTGEVSPVMLEEVGINLIELGHSERRHVLGETDEMVNRKVLCALRHGMTALLCIGETGEEKERGLSDEVLRTQLKAGLYTAELRDASQLWVAYEPVWAIGESGVPATKEYAEERHSTIRRTLVERFGEDLGNAIPILYGGSVNPQNATDLIQMEHIDGLFIGRSAWDATRFNGIIRDVLRVLHG